MAAQYGFSVFISYSSEDRRWAQRLYDDLKAEGVDGIRIFFDTHRLEEGVPWEPQLAANVPKSQHLVALWSEAAEKSDWVREETIRFKAEIDPRGTGDIPPDRRLFQVLLQPKQSAALNRYHAFTSLKDVNVAAGPEQMTPAQQQSWRAITRDIAEAVNPPSPATPWPVAVFAATKGVLNLSPPTAPQNYNGTFEDFLHTIGIPSFAVFESHYDDRPELWKPFGSATAVSQMLDNLIVDVNARLARNVAAAPLQMRWQYVDLVTQPFDRLDDEVQKLSTGACLLLIDPLSLRSQRMAERYTRLEPCFENRNATILWLTPFEPHRPTVVLRELVKISAQPLIRGYYEPVPPRPPLGRCELNVADSLDVGRLLLTAVASLSATVIAESVSPELRHATKQP